MVGFIVGALLIVLLATIQPASNAEVAAKIRIAAPTIGEATEGVVENVAVAVAVALGLVGANLEGTQEINDLRSRYRLHSPE